MPRTRRPAQKKSVKNPSTDLPMFRVSCKHVINNFDSNVKTSMNMLKSILKTSRKLIPPEIGGRLYKDVVKELLEAEEKVMANSNITSTCDDTIDATDAHSSTLRGSFDGVVSSIHPHDDPVVNAADKHVGFSELPPRTVNPKWKTPAVSHAAQPGTSAVTPKVQPEETVSVLRYPAQGEMAISMRGSPLLVTQQVGQGAVNVQVPLQDGRVLTIQPCAKFNMYEVPEIDHATRKQLQTIQDHIGSFLCLTEKAKRLKIK